MNWYKKHVTAGIIKPPEQIIKWMYDRAIPYVMQAKRNKLIEQIQKDIENNLNITQSNEKTLKDEFYNFTSKEISTINKETEKIKKINEHNEKRINDIKSNTTIKSITKSFPVPIGIPDANLTLNIKPKASSFAHFRHEVINGDENGIEYKPIFNGFIEIGAYQIIYTKLYDTKTKEYSQELRGDLEIESALYTTLGHEYIHFMQDEKSFNKLYYYGLPPQNISTPEFTDKKNDRIQDANKKFEYHTLIDTEFFTDLHDVISIMKSDMNKNIHGTHGFDFKYFIDRNAYMNAWKKHSTDKYKRALKETYRIFLEEYGKRKNQVSTIGNNTESF